MPRPQHPVISEKLMDDYEKKFGTPPPIVAIGPLDANRLMRQALRTGKPIEEVPEGVTPSDFFV